MSNMERKGLIHIYTGNGKGKTTSAVGLATRALGHELKVVYACFLKRPDLYGYNEINVLKGNGAKTFVFTEGHPHFDKDINQDKIDQIKKDVKEALVFLAKYIQDEKTDLLIMDEILIAVRDCFMEEQELISFIENKPEDCELVLTGRGATSAVIEKADYVSEIGMVKHPFEKGILGRKGIEY